MTVFEKPFDLHIHTLFSDGEGTPEETVLHAIKHGYHTIAITDHAEKHTPWFGEYFAEIDRLKKKYRDEIRLLCGLEVKVADYEGNLDLPSEAYGKLDILLGSVHSLPLPHGDSRTPDDLSKREIREYWRRAFYFLASNENITILAHPTAYFEIWAGPLEDEDRQWIIDTLTDHPKPMEYNPRYDVPDKPLREMLHQKKMIMSYGSDAHRLVSIVPRNLWGERVKTYLNPETLLDIVNI